MLPRATSPGRTAAAALGLVALLAPGLAGVARAQSMPVPAAVIRDATDRLVGPADIGLAGTVSLLLEVDGVLAQFDVVENGPESQVVWFDGNDCDGNPYLSQAGLQTLANMVGTQFGVAGGDPLAVNPAMADFNTYSSGTGTGAATLVKSTWVMQAGCLDLGAGSNEVVVAASPVATNPFAGMTRPFKVVRPALAIVVAEP